MKGLKELKQHDPLTFSGLVKVTPESTLVDRKIWFTRFAWFSKATYTLLPEARRVGGTNVLISDPKLKALPKVFPPLLLVASSKPCLLVKFSQPTET